MKKALFLDRDGVIIRDAGYAKDASVVTLIPGCAELIKRANAKGWKVIVVTNQSGLGRKWISLEQYQSVSRRMVELLTAKHAKLDQIYFAPFFEPENPGLEELQSPSFQSLSVPEKGKWDKSWRKPNPGMILQGAHEYQIDLAHSILIGDRATDQAAGNSAGLLSTYLIKSDVFEEEQNELSVWRAKFPKDQWRCHTIETYEEVELK